MDLQLIVTLGLVGLAVLYLGRRVFHTWSSRGTGCGGGCGCAGAGQGQRRNGLQELRLMRRNPTDA